MNLGLVLTGGGARAAYQVGVLRALAEILGPGPTPFRVVAGVSAGAINGVAVAAVADDFVKAVDRLSAVWMSLTPDQVYRTDPVSLTTLGPGWLRGLTGSRPAKAGRFNHLLDTEPLRQLLVEKLAIGRIPRHVANGRLRGVAVSATNYVSGSVVTFFAGAPEIPDWVRMSRLGERAVLGIDHVLASAAIPIFFPPVRIGNAFFGDGQIRLNAPISPAIHLGADRIIAIGVRYLRSPEQTRALEVTAPRPELTLSQITGVLMNAVFLDALESDIERLRRINQTLSLLPAARGARSGLRPIEILVLRPSQDLGALASDQVVRFPRVVRFMLKGMGASGPRGGDMLSYLAFERVYIERVVSLGHADTLGRRDEIEAFVGRGA